MWVLKKLHEKNSRVSLCVQELCHPQDSLWILATIPVRRNNTGLPVPVRDFSFLLGLVILVGLFNNSSYVSEEYGSLRTCLSTLSLDTIAGGWSEFSNSVEDVVGVEIDDLEEDVGWSICCLEGVMDVEEGKLEEELADKPRTTIGKKFSVLHCIRIPFLFKRCGFWPLIHSYEYPCLSQSFPNDKTAGVSLRTFIVKNKSNSLT